MLISTMVVQLVGHWHVETQSLDKVENGVRDPETATESSKQAPAKLVVPSLGHCFECFF